MSAFLSAPFGAIRSYVLGRGRMTNAQQCAWRCWQARYVVAAADNPPDWSAVFGKHAPLVVEIGSGYGQATACMVKAAVDCHHVVFEVNRAGVGALMNRLAADETDNVRIVCDDAMRFFPCMFAANSLERIHIFFPDPWPKRRHHKRRLIRPNFIAVLADKLAGGGKVHLATDWREYGEQMSLLFSTVAVFTQIPPPPRPITKYEFRAQREGRAVMDLCYQKN